MGLSQQDRNKRRAMIVRRWAAYRVEEAQRVAWRKRRAEQADDFEAGAGAGEGDLLAELPEGLLG